MFSFVYEVRARGPTLMRGATACALASQLIVQTTGGIDRPTFWGAPDFGNVYSNSSTSCYVCMK